MDCSRVRPFGPICHPFGDASSAVAGALTCNVLNLPISGKSVVRRALMVGVSTVLVAAGGAALAEVVSPDPVTPPSFTGPIYAVAYRAGTVYVGGNFTSASAGGKNVARSRLAAFDAGTGALL